MMDLNAWGGRWRRRVGLLGGSFNPAHDGHRHISLTALSQLGLDEVWWLVSPQNPLKPADGMAAFDDRLATARRVARHPKIRVTGIEAALGTHFTIDTLTTLLRRFPKVRFVWLMGADNLAQIPRWRQWASIFKSLPVAVFDRSPYSYHALSGPAAHRFRAFRRMTRQARRLALEAPPAWSYLRQRRHPASATDIRRDRRE